MRASITATLLAGLLSAGGIAQEKAPEPRPSLVDPVQGLIAGADETAATVERPLPRYDAAAIRRAVVALEGRAGTALAGPHDDYFIALGLLNLLAIHKYYDRYESQNMPAVFKKFDRDATAGKGRTHAQRYLDGNPKASDALRLMGEFHAHQISGMVSGMTEGPRAKEHLDRALKMDPNNGMAHFSSARMLFHNPAIAGGDKEKALETFKRLAREMPDFRVSLYMARSYLALDLYEKAYYWACKALAQAPLNPEVKRIHLQLRTVVEARRKQK